MFWTSIEVLKTQGGLNGFINALLPLAEANLEATGAVFVPGGKFGIKQRFQPTATMLPLWCPPKWGIDEKLSVPSG